MTITAAPVLRPSPLDLGGVITGAARIFRRRLGLFAALAFVPGLIAFGLAFGALVPLAAGVFASLDRGTLSGLVILGVALLFVATIVGALAQIKAQAMMSLAAHDEIHGRPSTFGDLYARTRGVIGRILGLLVLVTLVAFVVLGGFYAAMLAAIFGALATSDDVTAGLVTALVAYVLGLLVMLALAAVAYYFVIRFLYLMPILAVEGLGAVPALRRSWQLTKGNVLRTLGYFFVGSLIVGVAYYAVQALGQVLAIPLTAGSSGSDPSAPQIAATLIGAAIIMALQLAVQILAVPFQASYQTVMYVDQLRRDQLGPQPAPWPPAQPGPAPQWQPPAPQWGPPNGGQTNPPQWGAGPQQWGPGPS